MMQLPAAILVVLETLPVKSSDLHVSLEIHCL